MSLTMYTFKCMFSNHSLRSAPTQVTKFLWGTFVIISQSFTLRQCKQLAFQKGINGLCKGEVQRGLIQIALYHSACLPHQTFPEDINIRDCKNTLTSISTTYIVFCILSSYWVSGIVRHQWTHGCYTLLKTLAKTLTSLSPISRT